MCVKLFVIKFEEFKLQITALKSQTVQLLCERVRVLYVRCADHFLSASSRLH